MKLAKKLSPFVLLLIIGVITFRFLFFISYIKIQKNDFRKQLIQESKGQVFEVKLSEADLFIDKKGFDWKENNKELVINGVYHEVIAIKKINGQVLISLIEDKAENALFKNFFCVNKSTHKDFTDLIKLLLNLTYLENNLEFSLIKTDVNAEFRATTFHFYDLPYYLKLIKPPRF